MDFSFFPQLRLRYAARGDAVAASGRAVMLPSFRLIVITFLCGFAAVFAGLRLATSLNAALPVTTAHAGAHILSVADGEPHLASMPAMFDTRFAIAPAPAVLVRATPSVRERPSLPLAVMPPQSEATADAIPIATAAELVEQPSAPDGALAAVQSDPPADAATPAETTAPASPDAPLATDPQQ
jgi:hypothetical protein